MKKIRHICLLLASFTLLAACQTTKFNSDNSALSSEPQMTSAETDLNRQYLWGGEILNVENLANSTEITVISYPLDSNEKPKYKAQSTGRFIASHDGFLEPTDYRKGKLVTVKGTLKEFKAGKVAQADYQFPVLAVEQIKLQGKPSRSYGIPFSIGIGIGF